MIAYPFSGTVKDNVLDIDLGESYEYANHIVEKYCLSYGLSPIELKRMPGRKCANKNVNGIRIDQMRMALGFYLKNNTPLSTPNIAKIVGYNDHTTVVKMKRRVSNYIDNGDIVFYPYWKRLLEILH